MSVWLPALLLTLASTGASVEQDGVRIEVALQAHAYTWTVTNVDAAPITSLDLEHYAATEQEGPAGWEVEIEEPFLHAWATSERYAIHRGQSKTFSVRVKSTGGALGLVRATVGLDRVGPPDRVGDDRPRIVFAEVWGPVPKRRSMVIMVVVVVTGIAVGHTIVLERLEKRNPV